MERSWEDPYIEEGFHKGEYYFWQDEVYYRRNGKCWVENRCGISGHWYTYQYGTMHLVLKLEPAGSAKFSRSKEH
jgi:hypothetical protein